MAEVTSIRLDDKRRKALEQIHVSTKIPVSELIKQGVDRVIETYYIYIPDAQFRKQLSLVMGDSEDYLRRLADEG
jgi:hypothetical protein